MTLEQNVLSIIPSLTKFVTISEQNESHLDGYLIEIKGAEFSASIEKFSNTVNTILNIISRNDPSSINCMSMKSIHSSTWYFSFCNVPLFITTFAPFYSSMHCRHMLCNEGNKDSCYILLQPESSFLHHGINLDTPLTNWDHPQTFRDKIRVNFKKHNQEYFIPVSNQYPVAATFIQHPSNTSEYISNVDKDDMIQKGQTLLNPIMFWLSQQENKIIKI